jgi:hypothetical protein
MDVSESNGGTIMLIRPADGDAPWDMMLRSNMVGKFGSFFATTEQQG